MSLRGVVHGRTIEREEDPPPARRHPRRVELWARAPDPLWGPLANQPDLVQTPRQMIEERAQQRWRPPDEDGILFQV